MTGKPITQLTDQSWKTVAPKSCSNYKDYFALDVSKWAVLYKDQKVKDSTYVLTVPNKPSGR